MENRMVVLVDDRLWKSVGRDVVSMVTLVAMVGVGVLLQSSALQWVGAIIWFLWIIGKAASVDKKHKMTIAQAREFLDKLEGGKP